MCDVKNMTDEELKSLADRITVELKDRKNKERNALLKTLRDTAKQLYDIDPNYYMNEIIRTDCCCEEMEIDLFELLLDYFEIC
jgi:hypothetical protein